MMSSQINQKKVAKNTLMLYIRMGLVMVVSLYTSRVVLAALGVEDFGIYNVVGSVVVMFSFMNNTLTVAIRRFLSYELGLGDKGRIQDIFNSSIIAVLITSIIIVVGLETIGYWLLNYKLNIPLDRLDAANYVYQFSVLSFFFSINLIPFSSAIVAYEKMDIYAYLGIVETILKFGIALSLPYVWWDKLELYGLMIAVISLLFAFCNFAYCYYRVLKPSLHKSQWTDVRSIFKFSSWTIMGTMIFMLATQGVNMIYNVIYGVAINAALGIAQHVANAMNQFIGNFQTAYNPQLVKSYSAEGLSERTFRFSCQTSRLSILLIVIIGVPIIANVVPLLDFWLESIPDYAVPFTVLFILYMGIDGSSAPIYLLVYAKGNLKWYQIILGVIQLLYVGAVYFLCRLGLGPVMVLSFNVLCAIMMYIARLLFLKKDMNFPIRLYLESVIWPLIIPLILFGGIMILGNYITMDNSIVITMLRVLLTIIVVFLICFSLYLKDDERKIIMSFITKRLRLRLA